MLFRSLTLSLPVMLAVVGACQSPLEPQSADLLAKLSADVTALAVGDTAVLALTVTNTSRRKHTYDVGAGNWAFDVVIEDAAGGEVWRRSRQPSGIPATTLTLPPQGNVDFKWTLRIGEPLGVRLLPGPYKLRGLLIDSRGTVIATANPAIDVLILPEK